MPRPETPEAIDKAILRWLMDRNYDLWAVAFLERRVGDRQAVRASIRRLRREGLIYEGAFGFVAVTRAGRKAGQRPALRSMSSSA